MSKRLLVTGGSGFVAGSVIAHAGPDWEIHAIDRLEPPAFRKGVSWHRIDLRDADDLRRSFRRIRPDAVIHTAALADIDYCEEHQDEAEAVNVGVTRELARLCRELGAKLVFLSTDTVFDGERGHYSEEDSPGPLNFYAQTKVRAENVVAAEAGPAVVARMALVMGLPVLGSGNSFLSRMIPALKAGHEVGIPDIEIRSPIDVITLGHALLELAGNDFTGRIHLAGNDRLSRFAMLRRIVERLGYSPALVVVRNPANIPGRAPRPRDVSLNNARARATLRTPMRNLDEGIDLILAAKEGAVS